MAHSTSSKLIFCVLLVTWATRVLAEELLHTDASVAVKGGETINKYSRVKREINKEIKEFNSEERKAITDKHNILRRLQNSSNMIIMEWDPKLEESAHDVVQNCRFSHSSDSDRNNLAGYRSVGENIYVGSATFDPAQVVQTWYDEVYYFSYESLRCGLGQMCGHYTQVVWADSKAIGCGVKYCNELTGSHLKRGYIVVCQYGPGGNYVGVKPYKKGVHCSECPKELTFCIDGLCGKSSNQINNSFKSVDTSAPTPQSGSESGSIQNSRPQSGLFFLVMAVMWFVFRIML